MTITQVPGIRVGHADDQAAKTGCTAVVTEDGATCGVDVRGSAPGTRETDLLDPVNLVSRVHAISLAGGSAYGLDAASGVMQYLEERDVGMDVGVAKVPIVPSAILFDLAVGDPSIRPNRVMGYEAAERATEFPVIQGAVGAGTGATVGKVVGFDAASKSGIGSASIKLENGLVVGAIVAVNAFGDVVNPSTDTIVAGARNVETGDFLNSRQVLREQADAEGFPGSNTTLAVVAVNASLSKAEATKVAQVAQNAIARTISPAHTMLDGDTVFALATGDERYDINVISDLACDTLEQAILNAVRVNGA